MVVLFESFARAEGPACPNQIGFLNIAICGLCSCPAGDTTDLRQTTEVAIEGLARASDAQRAAGNLAGMIENTNKALAVARGSIWGVRAEMRRTVALLEERLRKLEQEGGKHGCPAFRDPAVQIKCLEAQVTTTAGTDQLAIREHHTTIRGSFVTKEKRSVVSGVETVETEYGIDKDAKSRPCIRTRRLTSATETAPGSILEIECDEPHSPLVLEGRPLPVEAPSTEESDSGLWRIATWGVLPAAGFAIGYGAGGASAPDEVRTDGSFAHGAGLKFGLIGMGTGLVVAGAIEGIVALVGD